MPEQKNETTVSEDFNALKLNFHNMIKSYPLLFRKTLCLFLAETLVEIYKDVERDSEEAARIALLNLLDVIKPKYEDN